MRFVSVAPSESFDLFFPPFQLNKLSRILARGRKKELMDDREINPWKCWSLTSCHLPAVRVSASSPECTWPNTDISKIPCLSLGCQKSGFIYWWGISNWHFPHSHCCFYVKVLLQGFKSNMHRCHWEHSHDHQQDLITLQLIFPHRTWKEQCMAEPACTVKESQSKYRRQLPLPFTL